jgi:diguanylate cyclase (GGDEF)-like protein
MRPDAVTWRNTNDLAALEFAPHHLIHRRVVAWVIRAMAMQTLLGLILFGLLQVYPVLDFAPTPQAAAASPEAAPTGRPEIAGAKTIIQSSPPPAFELPQWVPTSVRFQGQSLIRDAAVAQLCAMILTSIVVVPLVQARTRNRTRGLKELFEAIRSMAAGLTPKALPAGMPGESGYLALAFNDMASRLLASRRQLTEANQSLERRVDERTRELREAAARLEKMASTDALTGLANRRALADQGQSCFDLSVRRGTDLVCCLIDLDDFKQVNDTLGHRRGDELIRAAADSILRACGPDDLAARFGGDEFTVVIPDSDMDKASRLAQRIQDDFTRIVAELFQGSRIEKMPSMSIGIASRRQSGVVSFEELANRADAALYRAKEAGKARTEIDGPVHAPAS